MNIKYRTLKAFLLAVDSNSFTHAASRLGVTQPSFTGLIQNLENLLNLKLFERTTRSIKLTAAGEEFYARVQRPITDLEEAWRSMADLAATRRGNVVPGVLPSVALTLMPGAVAGLHKVSPAIRVRVMEAHNDELLSMLRFNQIEFALATVTDAIPDLCHMPLIDDCFCAVYPADHPLSTFTTLCWHNLFACDLILLTQGSSARQQFDQAVQDVGTQEPAILRYEVTNMGTAAGMVRQRLGVSVLPRLALPELNLDGLKYALLCDRSAHRTISLIHRRDHSLSPSAQALMVQIRNIIRVVERHLPPLT